MHGMNCLRSVGVLLENIHIEYSHIVLVIRDIPDSPTHPTYQESMVSLGFRLGKSVESRKIG